MKKRLESLLSSLVITLSLSAIFWGSLWAKHSQIYAQSPIGIQPAPTLTPITYPTPTSGIFITGSPIAGPTPVFIITSPIIQPITPIPTLAVYINPTPTYILPTPFHADPTPTQLNTPTPTPPPSIYWLSFGPNNQPHETWNTAEELLDYLSTFGVEAYEVDRWKNGGWDSHIHNLPFNDFPIKIGEGYEIGFKGNPGINNFIMPFKEIYSGPLTYNLGYWTDISIPSKLLKSIGNLPTAEDLCQSLINQGATAIEIDYHDLTPSPIFWSQHFCGKNENNFPIMQGKAYFVRTNTYSTWTLNPPAPILNKVNFSTTQVTFTADDFYIIANGKKFIPSNNVSVHSDPGNTNFTTLELTWNENGVEMRMNIYFQSDGTNWWTEEIRTYDGNNPGNWIYYFPGKIFLAKLKSFYFATEFNLYAIPNSQIHFTNLELQAFVNYISPTPTPTISPTPGSHEVPTSTPPVITPTPTNLPTPTVSPTKIQEVSISTPTPTIFITFVPLPKNTKPGGDEVFAKNCSSKKLNFFNSKNILISVDDLIFCIRPQPKERYNKIIQNIFWIDDYLFSIKV